MDAISIVHPNLNSDVNNFNYNPTFADTGELSNNFKQRRFYGYQRKT